MPTRGSSLVRRSIAPDGMVSGRRCSGTAPRAAASARATPWLPLIDPETRNVANQAQDPKSLLSLYRRLISVRQGEPALARGTHRSIFAVGAGVLAWLREADGDRVLVLLNTAAEPAACSLPDLGADAGAVVVATSDRSGAVTLGGLVLQPHEGIALRL